MKPTCKPLALALSAAFAAGTTTAFAAADLGRGYEVAANAPAAEAKPAPAAQPAPAPAAAPAAASAPAAKPAGAAVAKSDPQAGKADAKSAEHGCGEGSCGAAPPKH